MDLTNILRQVDRIDGFYSALKIQEKSLIETINILKKDIERDIKASAVLKHLLDIMIKNEISKMASLITYGLKTIFDDQNLTFIPEIKTKAGKIAINFKTMNDDIETDFKSSGGSISVIESFLIRILCILKKSLAKLVLLDETFSAIGDEYIPNTGKFVNELAKKINIDILLVTHKKEYKQYANHAYKVIESKKGLIMEKIK